jgi:hypothetical protein
MGHLVQIMTLIGGFALIAAACSVSTDDQPTISSASPPADVPATSVVESPGSDTTIESPTPPDNAISHHSANLHRLAAVHRIDERRTKRHLDVRAC